MRNIAVAMLVTLAFAAPARAADVPGPDGSWPSDHFGVVTKILIAD